MTTTPGNRLKLHGAQPTVPTGRQIRLKGANSLLKTRERIENGSATDAVWCFAVQNALPYGWHVTHLSLSDRPSVWMATNPRLGYLHTEPLSATTPSRLISSVWEATLTQNPDSFRAWPSERTISFLPGVFRGTRR